MLKKKRGKIVANTVLIGIGLSFLIPTLWLIFAGFDKNAAALLKWPEWTTENFSNVLGSSRNIISFKNSLSIALSSALISTVLGSIAAYPLSRFRGKYKNAFMLTILLMSTMPMTVAMVPIFKFFGEYRTQRQPGWPYLAFKRHGHAVFDLVDAKFL